MQAVWSKRSTQDALVSYCGHLGDAVVGDGELLSTVAATSPEVAVESDCHQSLSFVGMNSKNI